MRFAINARELQTTFLIVKLFMKTGQILILLLLLWGAKNQQNKPCDCQNGGTCSPNGRCLCSYDFIGEHCQQPARPLGSEPLQSPLFGGYSHFYFQPQESNFFKLNFSVCMLTNPSKSDTLFFIETEKNNGSLRATPSLFQTVRLVLGEDGCVNFTTHYISVKRREDDSFRRIIIGMKPMGVNDTSHYLNVYRSSNMPQLSMDDLHIDDQMSSLPHFQEVKISMTYQVYLQNNYYSSYVILLTASSLIILLTLFVSYLRKKYSERERDDNLSGDDFRMDFRYQSNPERIERERKNNLTIVQVFMPMTLYGQGSKYFLSEILGTVKEEPTSYPDHDTCSICLVEFTSDQEIRTTPCKHRYHRDCIDDWCQNNLSCPICRHPLDFSKQIKKIYFHYLRGDLHRCRRIQT